MQHCADCRPVLGRIDQQHDELVAAEPRHDVVGADGGDHPLGHGLEQRVAGAVAEAVVDVLEVVEVDVDDAQPCAALRRRLQRLRQLFAEPGAVGQAGQLVVGGHELDALFGAPTGDGDAGDVDGHLQQPRLDRGRRPHGARIHREHRQRLAAIGKDRRRPAGAIAVRPDELAKVGPQRVGEDVGDDHRLATIGRGAARSGARPDLGPVDRLDVVGRQARRGAVAQPAPLLVEQQDGAQDAVELQFDQPRQCVEDRLERRAHGDHFEDLRLAVAQQIGETAVGDVARNAGDAKDVAARVAHRHLGRQEPGLAARAVVKILLEVDHRPAGADDLLLVVEELLRDLQRQQLEVVLADHVSGFG